MYSQKFTLRSQARQGITVFPIAFWGWKDFVSCKLTAFTTTKGIAVNNGYL
jgi:hypothetical protein